MSDKPIQVGDLVMVVRPKRCGCAESSGKIFKVDWVGPSPIGGRCVSCKTLTFPDKTMCVEWRAMDGYIEMSRLKRLDPDALKDDVPTHEGITA